MLLCWCGGKVCAGGLGLFDAALGTAKNDKRLKEKKGNNQRYYTKNVYRQVTGNKCAHKEKSAEV